jgi:hypothetical protein
MAHMRYEDYYYQPTWTERSSSTMHDNDPQVLELEKARNLAKKQYLTSAPHKHAPGWNESLASESEAHIKVEQILDNIVKNP